MKTNELAIDADGEPFAVPPEVTGWRVRRVEGRGRPELAYDRMGRTVVVPVDATYADLFRAAGAGRYRLDPVDAKGHICADVTVACTGHMQAATEDLRSDSAEPPNERAPVVSTSTAVRPFVGYDDILAETIRSLTRVAEMAIGKVPAMLTAAGGLITAADGANLTNRQPLQLAAPELDAADAQDAPPVAPAGMPEWLGHLIQQAAQALVPIFMAKLPALSRLPGLSADALLDWRRAVPSTPTAVADAGVPLEPPTPRVRISATVAKEQTVPSAQPSAPPRSSLDDSTAINAHILQVWQALSAAEQTRAQQLAAALTPDERAAWIFDLAARSVVDAVARVRELIQPQTVAPITAVESGDKS